LLVRCPASVNGYGRVSRFRDQNAWIRRFRDRELSVEVNAKKSQAQIACPDSRSGLVLRLSASKRSSLHDSYLRRARPKKRLLFVNYLLIAGFASRVETFF